MALSGHTFLISGGADRLPQLQLFLESEGVSVQGNPDVYQRIFAQCGVDEVRDVRARAVTRALAGRRVFVIVAQVITVEAQNALLKTLEEPVEGTLFFFIVPSPEMLLPTLRSRAQMLDIGSVENREGVLDARAFLAAPSAARIDMLKPLLEKGDDDKRDMASVVGFLSELERILAPHVANGAVRQGISAVYRARSYCDDKGALVKPLLEQVALLVPTSKL